VYGLNLAINFRKADLQPGDISCQMGPVPTQAENVVSLANGESLYSPARAFRFTFQPDGSAVPQYVWMSNLRAGWPNDVLLPSEVTWIPIWATGTNGGNAVRDRSVVQPVKTMQECYRKIPRAIPMIRCASLQRSYGPSASNGAHSTWDTSDPATGSPASQRAVKSRIV
jgi:hypothetical protein